MGWHFDRRHLVPGERLPMEFHARAVAPPAPLCCSPGTLAVDANNLHVPQLRACQLVDHAIAMLTFVERSPAAPVLPDDEFAATLYWRLVSTDSCEACHCGVLLTLRRLLLGMQIPLFVTADGRRERIVAFGMQNALRVAPFARHVMTPRDGCQVITPLSGCGVDATPTQAKLEVILGETPARVAHGGALHQLVWMRSDLGAEFVMDFTGAQYGVDEVLASTRTPFWLARIPEGRAAGEPCRVAHDFELRGTACLYSDAQLDPAVLENKIHAHVGLKIRDGVIGVLQHRQHANSS